MRSTPECRMLPAIIEPFTPKQQSRLKTFTNLVRMARAANADSRTGNPSVFGYVVEGKMTERYFTMDSRFVATINETAEAMYRDELATDPITKVAADSILNSVREEFDGPPAMTPAEAQVLFERP